MLPVPASDAILRGHRRTLARSGDSSSWYTRCIYEAPMKTTIQKWGNSLAVRIPRPFAEEIHLEENTTVDLTIRSGKLVIVPAEPALTLESLVDQITDENRHDAVGTGTRLGNEVW
jgi:antitoxin MazE